MPLASSLRFRKAPEMKTLSALALVVVVVSTFCDGTDVVQWPKVTSCMTGKHGFRLRDFSIQDSKVGRYMRVNYTVDVLREGRSFASRQVYRAQLCRPADSLRGRFRLLHIQGLRGNKVN
ncbi:uncharacterized protein LOC119464921 [Dermacentor silvarum]|uniref:uncharacterized protein LOC119464921 n=1 Tax=Dermacentor silvarum TaxID=543639 RepID=UPI002101551B|nr:uncharacterized protein LOC119464921 [Dermacentor silvarum]